MNVMRQVALGLLLAVVLATGPPPGRSVQAQPNAPVDQQEFAEGKRLFRADCAGCHKWHGNGGGGYGGAALSLRNTHLNRDQIIETVGCGRPGTGMPFHLRDAYDSNKCYGLTTQQLAGMMPQAAAAFLRPADIAVIADYVLAKVKGRGEPNYAECVDFFGTSSRVCEIYQSEQERQAGRAGESR
jgi:cbb3-type cytochrome c oxidase subunit III